MDYLLRKVKENPFGVGSFIYLVFPIINLFYIDINGPLALAIVWIVVFSLNYIIIILSDIYLFKVRRIAAWLIYLAGVIYFCWAMGSMFIMFFFFGSFVLPYVYQCSVKSIETILYFIALLVATGISLYLLPAASPIIFVLDLVVLIALFSNFRINDSSKAKAQLEQKNRYINLLIAEQERQRIGQDLHDTLGHVFASLSIKSELAVKLVDQHPEQAKKEMMMVNELSKEALNKVRGIVETLKFQDFKEEVISVRNLLDQADIAFEFKGEDQARTMNRGQQSVLSMILREAVNNIIKHAHATKVNGWLKEEKQTIVLMISDNGLGMKDNETQTLHSIEERVALLNGTLNIASHHGVTLTIEIPRGESL